MKRDRVQIEICSLLKNQLVAKKRWHQGKKYESISEKSLNVICYIVKRRKGGGTLSWCEFAV